jgi:hypothetical protein
MNANLHKILRFLLSAINKRIFPLDFSSGIDFSIGGLDPGFLSQLSSKLCSGCKWGWAGTLPDFLTQLCDNNRSL